MDAQTRVREQLNARRVTWQMAATYFSVTRQRIHILMRGPRPLSAYWQARFEQYIDWIDSADAVARDPNRAVVDPTDGG